MCEGVILCVGEKSNFQSCKCEGKKENVRKKNDSVKAFLAPRPWQGLEGVQGPAMLRIRCCGPSYPAFSSSGFTHDVSG